MMNKHMLSIFVLLLLAGCNSEKTPVEEKPEVSVIRKYYPNGQLKIEVPVAFNKKNGLAKSFYKTGRLRQSVEYLNGLKHGEVRTYYEDGDLYMVSRYKYNHLHGVRERYHPDGQLMSEAPFFEGEPAVGLREYLVDGSPRKYYPLINVEEGSKARNDILNLEISLSDGTKRVEFYIGDLNPNGYIDNRASILDTSGEGKAALTVELSSFESTVETIRILARATTLQGNTYITQHDHMVASVVSSTN